MATHNDFGAKAEKFAKSYLLENNYEILETNYRFGKAEIDIIAKKDDLLIIVEVKARQYNSLKQPFEAVNKKKIELIHSATDHFINNIGIVGVALLACLVISWALRKLPVLRDHLNEYSSFQVNKVWMALVSVVAPLVLLSLWITEIITVASKGYGEMPRNFVGIFGWGMSILVVVLAIVLSLIPWPHRSAIHHELTHEEEMACENFQETEEGALS